MPKYYKKKRSYGRKKKSYRKRRSSSNSLAMYRPLRRTQVFKTRYVDRVEIDPGTVGTPAVHFFSCNGLFDPDITGSGHQPIGFDQMVGTLYDHYTVIGARISIQAQNVDTTYSQTVVITVQDNSVADTDFRSVLENGNTKYMFLAPGGSGGNSKTLKANINPNKFLGRAKPMSEDDLRGTASANPVEQCFFGIYAFPDDAANSSPVRCLVTIDYLAILTEPKKLGVS